MNRTKTTYKIIRRTTLTGRLSDTECGGCCYDSNDTSLPLDCPMELDCATPVKTKDGIKYIVWEFINQ